MVVIEDTQYYFNSLGEQLVGYKGEVGEDRWKANDRAGVMHSTASRHARLCSYVRKFLCSAKSCCERLTRPQLMHSMA